MACFWNGPGLDDSSAAWASFMPSRKKVTLKKVFIGTKLDIQQKMAV
ncbi:hypothetical protein [Lactiplantibacillus plantarum]